MQNFYHETNSQQESPRLSSKKAVSRNGPVSKSLVKESRTTKTYQRRNVYTSNQNYAAMGPQHNPLFQKSVNQSIDYSSGASTSFGMYALGNPNPKQQIKQAKMMYGE